MYKGLGPNSGILVPDDEARGYALSQLGLAENTGTDQDAVDELVEWFFSGNWLHLDPEEYIPFGIYAPPIYYDDESECYHLPGDYLLGRGDVC